MNRLLEVTAAVLIAAIFALAVVSSAQAQQQSSADPKDYQDAIQVLQRETETERNARRSVELIVVKLQRELAEAKKAAEACRPEKDKKK